MEVKNAFAPPSASPAISSELEVRIRKRFLNREGSFHLNVHFRALAGFTILFGASGAGKTTLLDCIAGLTDPDDGRIVVGGEAMYDSELKRNVPAWKRRIGYVLQDLALFPHMTAEQNVAYGLRQLDAAERQARSREMLAAFRIDHLRDRRPAQISGGERQRVALARALVTEPRALMLDEPLAALDRPTKSQILADLRQWNHHYRVPILFVTHSREEVFALGQEVIALDAGKIVAQGMPRDVLEAPRIETVAQLSGFENIFDATVAGIHEDRGTMTCRVDTGNRPPSSWSWRLRWCEGTPGRSCESAFGRATSCWRPKVRGGSARAIFCPERSCGWNGGTGLFQRGWIVGAYSLKSI